jgi:predicted membrane chloride channel (bestrophin family)
VIQVLQTRALANIIKTYVYPQCPNASISVIRHLAVMGWVLKSFVRGKDTDWEVVKIMLDGTDSQDYQWMTSQTKPTVALTARVRQICGVALGNMSGLSPCVAGGILLVIEERIRELENIVGACQRLFSSPIPPTYSRHLSRVISLWIFFLPVSLIAAALPPLGVTLATTCAAYVIIGIDEVGMEIENSFQLLPLQQLCWAVQTDVREAFFADMPEVEV